MSASERPTLGVTGRADGNMKDEAARRAALAARGLEGLPAFYLKQVHGVGVLPAAAPPAPSPAPEGDGWITATPGLVLCVFVADCVPLFIWDAERRAAGVFHAGWRGMAAGMAAEAAKSFGRFYGIRPEGLRAAIGPHIGACCYRVGPETAARFRPESVRDREGGRYVDLSAEAVAQLREAGVSAPVEHAKACTCCGEGWFSFRRDKTDARMMAFVTIDK